MSGEWQVHVTDDWLTDTERLVIFRRIGEGRVHVVKEMHADGTTLIETLDNEIVGPTGLAMPRGVLRAIAEVAKPGPSMGEIKRLEEALTVERGRVDNLLDRLTLATP